MKIFRVAPSPTGRLHFGHLKPYLLNYSLAKANNGRLILRIEDTDQKRNKMETVRDILTDLEWLGIRYDDGPTGDTPNEYFQSQRLEIYQKYIDQLIGEGKAYKAYETAEERALQIEDQRKSGKLPVYSGAHADLTKEQQEAFEREGRKPVVRLRVPKNEIIEFEDGIYGNVKTNTNVIGDIVIQKSDGFPIYNFGVVIDDHLMGVTNVVRGFEHLANTPKQILIYKALGWETPEFAHFSSILNELMPGKLSKRSGAKAITQYRAEGYLPEAIFNYVIVISCSFTFSNKDEEIMSLEEIYSRISIDKILKSNAKFNTQKLDWFNGQHIRKLSTKDFIDKVLTWIELDAYELSTFIPEFDVKLIEIFKDNSEILRRALPLLQIRLNKYSEIFDQLKFLFIAPEASHIDISHSKHSPDEFEKAARILYNKINSLGLPWNHENWESSIRAEADALGWKHGDLFMALRLLIVGDRFSPPLFEVMEILGKEECLLRIEKFYK